MKSISELTDFYYKTLAPVLQELEKERKGVKNRVIKLGISYLVIVAFTGLLILRYSDGQIDMFLFFCFAAFTLGVILYKYLVKGYKSTFKEKIITPLIQELDKNLEYLPQKHIDETYFTRSKFFTSRPDRVSGNDYIHGKIDGVPIQLSDFHAERRYQDSKGNITWRTMFQGLFIVSEFNKNFQGQTVVLPDKAQHTFGDLVGNWLQSNNFSRNELVKMDDPEFEKEFVVYATDQVEARYILTHTLMQKLLHYKKESEHPLYTSFVGGNIYLAIDYNKDLFEASVFHSLLKYKIAMEYLKTLQLGVGVVKELNLNQKLWSKI